MQEITVLDQDMLMEELKKIAAITFPLVTKEEKEEALRKAGYNEEFITLFLNPPRKKKVKKNPENIEVGIPMDSWIGHS